MTDNIFYFDNDLTKPINASGVIIYRNHFNKMLCLIHDHNNLYEDIGGSIDQTNGTLLGIVGREVEEKTNGIICSSDIIERLETAKKIYIPVSKYCLFIIEASEKENMLKKEDFRTDTKQDNLRKTIGWIARDNLSSPNVIRYRINQRLHNKAIFTYLKTLEKNMKYSRYLFEKEINISDHSSDEYSSDE